MNVESEIRDLKRSVGGLEGSFGFLMQQVKAVHRDLLAFQAKTERRFDRLETDVRGLRTEVRSLREDMPDIVGKAVREVLGPARGKPRKKQ